MGKNSTFYPLFFPNSFKSTPLPLHQVIRHKTQCCELFSLMKFNKMSEDSKNQARPTIVMLPEAEWENIKGLLSEVKNTLKTKSAEEINSQWLESDKARELLGVSRKTWQTYRDNRVLPFVQFGRKIFVRRADLEAFMEKHLILAKA